MQALERKKSGEEPFSEVFLQLYETDFPERYLPRGDNGERLSLPAPARLRIGEEGIKIDVIVDEGPGGYYSSDYEPPSFDDVDPPIIPMNFHREKIRRVLIGGRQGWRPTAILAISDPTQVVEEFTLTFVSTDSNNADYHILKLAKHVRERLRATVEEVSAHRREIDDIPF